MSVSKLDDLLTISDTDLKHVYGTITSTIHSVSTPEKVKKSSLVFVSTKEQWAASLAGGASAIIALEKICRLTYPKMSAFFQLKI